MNYKNISKHDFIIPIEIFVNLYQKCDIITEEFCYTWYNEYIDNFKPKWYYIIKSPIDKTEWKHIFNYATIRPLSIMGFNPNESRKLLMKNSKSYSIMKCTFRQKVNIMREDYIKIYEIGRAHV